MITLFNGIICELDSKTFTASITGFLKSLTQESIIIPRSFKNGKTEYIITRIKESSFNNCPAKSLEFSNDSELQTIESFSFCFSSIESISIPASVNEIQEGWCINAYNLKTIYVSPKNTKFSFLDNKMLIGKSTEKEDSTYNSILFVRSDVNQIVIPSFIRHISVGLFNSFVHLTKITFADDSKLEEISRISFSNSSISFIKIPSSVTKIRSNAFCNCAKLKTVLFSDNSQLKSLGKSVFSLSAIESITLPKGVTDVKEETFMNCIFLKSIEFQENSKLNSISKYMFLSSTLHSILIPSSITRIHHGAFYYCKKLKVVSFSENSKLQFIDDFAFASTMIEEISLPSSLTRIGNKAFNKCYDLKSFDVPFNSKLQEIGTECFSETQIDNLFIPSSIKLEEGFFKEMPVLVNITISEDNGSMIVFDHKVVLKKSNPNNDLFDILLLAFKNIQKFNVPDFIREIGEISFNACKLLNEINFSDNSQVVSINKGAFSKSSIENILIPKSVTQICNSAFENSDLRFIGFSPFSELKYIGMKAFFNCNLTEILIPSSVTKIDDNAFLDCSNLKTINFAENSILKYIGSNAFKGTKISHFTLLPSVSYIGDNAFSDCQNMWTIEIPSDTKLNNIKQAFSASSFEYIAIPERITFIDDWALSLSNRLVGVEFLGENITTGNYCFMKCFSLSIISFPNAYSINNSLKNIIDFFHSFRNNFYIYCQPSAFENGEYFYADEEEYSEY